MAKDSVRQSGDNKSKKRKHMGEKKYKITPKKTIKRTETREGYYPSCLLVSSTPKYVLDCFLAKHKALLYKQQEKGDSREAETEAGQEPPRQQ